MTDAWNQALSLADKHANTTGGLFVRLANHGDKVVGIFVGDPYPREVVWTGVRYEDYDPKVHTDERPKLRVLMNFFVPADDAMKVIEGGVGWFKDLLKVRDKYGLDAWAFEVERHGETGNPKTTYTILPDHPITDEERRAIAAQPPHDLAKIASGDSDKGKEQNGFDSYEAQKKGNTLDPQATMALGTRLKALPPAAVENFLRTFGVQRIRDLKASDQPAAEKLIRALEAEHGPQTEVDPFS